MLKNEPADFADLRERQQCMVSSRCQATISLCNNTGCMHGVDAAQNRYRNMKLQTRSVWTESSIDRMCGKQTGNKDMPISSKQAEREALLQSIVSLLSVPCDAYTSKTDRKVDSWRLHPNCPLLNAAASQLFHFCFLKTSPFPWLTVGLMSVAC